jgi:hypothetical protein
MLRMKSESHPWRQISLYKPSGNQSLALNKLILACDAPLGGLNDSLATYEWKFCHGDKLCMIRISCISNIDFVKV